MGTISNTLKYFNNIKDVCLENSVDIESYSALDNDCYITFVLDDNTFFDKLYILRIYEYVFQFELIDNIIYFTISGNDKLFEDILVSLDKEIIKYNDIGEIISFLRKFDNGNVVSTLYFSGVTYYYNISDNIYGRALEYNNFLFDGYYYRYHSNNCEVCYENMKVANKEIGVYKKLMVDTNVIDNVDLIGKNTCICDIYDVYNEIGSKEIYLIERDRRYFLIIKVGDNSYKYQYNNLFFIRNMFPEILKMYFDNSNGVYSEDMNSCIGKSFYRNILSNNNKLFIYNIDNNVLEDYLGYLRKILVELKDNNLNDNNISNNAGYISFFLIVMGVLIFCIFVFVITFYLIK